MIKFFQGGNDEAKNYTKGSGRKIIPSCPDCGKTKTFPMSISNIYTYKSICCTCGDGHSYPEKFMACILDQLNLNYKWKYRPDWLLDTKNRKREYDFLIGDLIIEIDGGIGHGKKVYTNSHHTVEKTKCIDNWKDKQAKKMGLSVIRINADKSDKEYLKNSITNALSDIFDLSIVDWDMCDKFATKNLVKTVCNYYNSNINATSVIAKQFNLSWWTINNYLKRGNELGWCVFPTDEFHNKTKLHSQNATIQHLSKNVAVYKNNILLKQYVSTAECAKNSLSDFGIKFSQSNISCSARVIGKLYKGYTFKYV